MFDLLGKCKSQIGLEKVKIGSCTLKEMFQEVCKRIGEEADSRIGFRERDS